MAVAAFSANVLLPNSDSAPTSIAKRSVDSKVLRDISDRIRVAQVGPRQTFQRPISMGQC